MNRKESRSFFRVRTWGCSIEGVTFTCEPQFAVIPLVLEQLAQIRKHLPAIAADQDIRVACNVEIVNWFPFSFDLCRLIAYQILITRRSRSSLIVFLSLFQIESVR